MERVVAMRGGCGEAIRDRHPAQSSSPRRPGCGTRSLPPAPPLPQPDEPLDDGHARSTKARSRAPLVLGVLVPAALLAVLWQGIARSGPERGMSSDSPSRIERDADATPATSRAEDDRGPARRDLAERRDRPDRSDDARVATSRASLPIRSVSDRSTKSPSVMPPPPPAPLPSVKTAPATIDPVTPWTAESVFADTAPQRFKILDEDGGTLVARLHGEHAGKTLLLLPDGQLGFPNLLVPTQEPFRPFTADELLPRLRRSLPADFTVFQTAHYLIFYKRNHEFAESSGKLLEELYQRLLTAFRKHGLPVHETEFPLVAVIYPTEEEFRAHHPVDPEIQAFFEIATNRIYFYERSTRDESAPEVAAVRKPQTVAHEGTHQILQNIGVHPRMSQWPVWLVEGLAEYCAAPVCTKGGKPSWDGLGMINPLHLTTIRELDDPLSMAVRQRGGQARARLREPGKPLAEVLIARSRLTPTEYALAWAMTHYLAFKRQGEFIAYLKRMSQLPPLAPRAAEEHLADFREVFGQDLARLDRAIDGYLRKLARQKGYSPMPYYAVIFEQPLPAGLFRRAGMVSQSPQMIQQWVQDISNPQGAQPTWQALPQPTRARALRAIENWMHSP